MTYGPSLIFQPHILNYCNCFSPVTHFKHTSANACQGQAVQGFWDEHARSAFRELGIKAFCVSDGSSHLSPPCEPRAHSRK